VRQWSCVQACRSAERTAPVCDAIRAETGNDAVEYWHLGAATPLILRNCLHDDSPPSRELLSLCLVIRLTPPPSWRHGRRRHELARLRASVRTESRGHACRRARQQRWGTNTNLAHPHKSLSLSLARVLPFSHTYTSLVRTRSARAKPSVPLAAPATPSVRWLNTKLEQRRSGRAV